MILDRFRKQKTVNTAIMDFGRACSILLEQHLEKTGKKDYFRTRIKMGAKLQFMFAPELPPKEGQETFGELSAFLVAGYDETELLFSFALENVPASRKAKLS